MRVGQALDDLSSGLSAAAYEGITGDKATTFTQKKSTGTNLYEIGAGLVQQALSAAAPVAAGTFGAATGAVGSTETGANVLQ